MNSPVLVLRVNNLQEICDTVDIFAPLAAHFPESPFYTLSTPQTGLTPLIEQDPHFTRVLIYPPPESPDRTKSARGLQRFLRTEEIGATVVVVGSTPYLEYAKHVASILACPGPRYFLTPQRRLIPLLSGPGIALLAAALVHLAVHPFVSRVQRISHGPLLKLLWRKALSAGAAPAGDRPLRVLWIRLDHIGDNVMSLPALRSIKAAYPASRVDLLTQSINKPLLQQDPGIDDILVYNSPTRYKGKDGPSSLRHLWNLIRELRRRSYDIAIDTRGDNTARVIAFLSGARNRIGLCPSPHYSADYGELALLLTQPVSLPAFGHAVDNSLSLVRAAGIGAPGAHWEWHVSEAQRTETATKLATLAVTGDYAVIHGASNEKYKMWKPESFALVADHLATAYGLTVLISGAPGDRSYNEEILSSVQHRSQIIDIAGVFTLDELPALLEKAKIMVTVDTGPMHIAAAVGTPIAALFQQANTASYSPYRQEDHVLDTETVLDTILPNQVINLVDRVLREAAETRAGLESG